MSRGLALAVCLIAAAFAVGLSIGVRVDAPGTTRVPSEHGTPADLPAWACDELVASRMEEWEESITRHLEPEPDLERPRGIVWHRPALDVCSSR